MPMKEIRAWENEFFNFNNLSYPKLDNITHRLMTNIIYFNQNYIICFVVNFLFNS